MNRILLSSALLLMMTACAGFPFFQKPKQRAFGMTEEDKAAACAATSTARTELEIKEPAYDGQTVSTRILVGVREGRLCLDRRFIVNATVNIDSVRECATGLPPTYILAESFPPPPREEDLLVLTPGYWYGAQVHLPLFSEHLGLIGPDCIEVTLSVFPPNGPRVGPLSIRAERNPPSSPKTAPPAELLLPTDEHEAPSH